MEKIFLKEHFKKMPWKNGNENTLQICIYPESSRFEDNQFLYRFSSAPIPKSCEFSSFPGMMRLLVAIKGAGFRLNSRVYEKFEVAHFSGDERTTCELLKDEVQDFGIIYNSEKVKLQPRVLQLKSDLSFSIDPLSQYFVTVLSGNLIFGDKNLQELETLHLNSESTCDLKVNRASVLFFLKMELKGT